ncbi:MAG: copper chaperone PCu(A)C [Paracoccus sp. (in: a-proteobacteria)]|uniref:copper chaperone PCu(A)C n=1 Tax=Paracoccus sp. TaxID=267 RepID=UPI0039E3D733
MRTIFLATLAALALHVPDVWAQAHSGHAGAIPMPVMLGDLVISRGYGRATPPHAPVGTGYLSIQNQGRVPDRLLGAESPAAGRVEIHRMAMRDGVMRMRPLPKGIEIPAGATVDLRPGGAHLMLMALKAPLVEGARLPVKLRFERAGRIEVQLAVGPLDATGGHE